MPAPYRLRFALEQRSAARDADIAAAETPGEELAAEFGYLRSLLKRGERVDPEAAAAITKRAAQDVAVRAAEVKGLIEQAISPPQDPAGTPERRRPGAEPAAGPADQTDSQTAPEGGPRHAPPR